MFLISMVGWISIVIYQSSLLENMLKHHQVELVLPVNPMTRDMRAKPEGPLMPDLNNLSDMVQKTPEEKDSSAKVHFLIVMDFIP